MTKYEALGRYLRAQMREHVPMTFDEIERVTGERLPRSQRYPAWWSNNTSNNVMTKIWLDAGYRTESVDIEGRKLVFRKAAPSSSGGGGMAEEGRSYLAEAIGEKKPRRHPAFGALKGTFMIEPGWDLTRPSMDPEELDEMEANLERTADMIEKGLSGKSE
jgi:peptidoglycan/xylan/chitin deacetylase (PgdA/CDA1 family)